MTRTRILCSIAVLALLLGAPSLGAQTQPLEHTIKPFSLVSGELANSESAARGVYSKVIDGGDVPWMRLSFGRTVLPRGSKLVISSLLDGATQNLDATNLARWRNSSAYFNGNQVRVSLVAGPGTVGNRVEVNALVVGSWSPPQESQCGPTDDRVTSDRPERGRLLDIGCTASIYNEDSCFLTAGHCINGGFLVSTMEFNVPLSNPNGSLNHPGPEDQYTVDTSDLSNFQDAGVGADWGLFRVFPNSETGLMPFEAQGAHMTLSDTVPGSGTVEIVGYGVDDGVDNQTQQVSTGPITSAPGTTLSYQSDTEGGNSGSAVVDFSTGEVIAVHTHGGCTQGGGANSGTQITRQNLQDAIQSYCPVTGAIRIDSLVPGIAGMDNTWNMSGATPFGDVSLRCRPQGAPNATALGTVSANANGEASLTAFIPGAGSGATIECRAKDETTEGLSGTFIFVLG